MNEPDLPANTRDHMKAVESIASTFQKRIVAGLQIERSGPTQQFHNENLPRKRPRFSLNPCDIVRTCQSGM